MSGRFDTGDIVKISRTSKYYGRNSNNDPEDMEGMIVDMNVSDNEFYPDHNIKVEWNHSMNTNIYRENDLRLVRRQQIVRRQQRITDDIPF